MLDWELDSVSVLAKGLALVELLVMQLEKRLAKVSVMLGRRLDLHLATVLGQVSVTKSVQTSAAELESASGSRRRVSSRM